jgi:hypothetical protein
MTHLIVDELDRVNCPKHGAGILSYHCDNCPYLHGFGQLGDEEFIQCSWAVI